VTWGDGSDLSKLLQVVHGDLVAGKVEHDVLEGTANQGVNILQIQTMPSTHA
jgi:hypothetical protein